MFFCIRCLNLRASLCLITSQCYCQHHSGVTNTLTQTRQRRQRDRAHASCKYVKCPTELARVCVDGIFAFRICMRMWCVNSQQSQQASSETLRAVRKLKRPCTPTPNHPDQKTLAQAKAKNAPSIFSHHIHHSIPLNHTLATHTSMVHLYYAFFYGTFYILVPHMKKRRDNARYVTVGCYLYFEWVRDCNRHWGRAG